MKQMIIDKIDRLVEQGYSVTKTHSGYCIDKILVYTDSDFFPGFVVDNVDLDDKDANDVYLYLKLLYEKQFIKYLKED